MKDNNPNIEMDAILAKQKEANLRDGIPSVNKRIDLIDRTIDLLVTHCDQLCEAVCEDFGHRSIDQSKMTDVAASIMALKYAKKHLKKWMKPEKRSVDFPLGLLGAKARLVYQPKGVVGVISPWNFPIGLTFTPLAGIFAAGNRAMIKTSEYTPRTSKLTSTLVSEYFDEEELVVVTGGPEVGAQFSQLPFDHLLFTGATSIARHVMRSAADNLVPLTLELGGKSPVIISKSADMEKTANRIMSGKTLNAGQICLAPDYVFVHESNMKELIVEMKNAVESMYPDGLKENDDYCSMVNEPHFQRINGYIEEAKNSSAEVIQINSKSEHFADQKHHKIPPTLIVDAPDNITAMQDEIFGPVLPIKPYTDIQEAINYVNSRPRPLALYYFGDDKVEENQVIKDTISGGITINDVIFHVGQEDLPFGGIGDSGMGVYHGFDGFKEFSHQKAIYSQIGSEVLAMIRPPFGDKYRKLVGRYIKK